MATPTVAARSGPGAPGPDDEHDPAGPAGELARAERLTPGTRVEVEGQLRRRWWEAGGARRSRVEVLASAIAPVDDPRCRRDTGAASPGTRSTAASPAARRTDAATPGPHRPPGHASAWDRRQRPSARRRSRRGRRPPRRSGRPRPDSGRRAARGGAAPGRLHQREGRRPDHVAGLGGLDAGPFGAQRADVVHSGWPGSTRSPGRRAARGSRRARPATTATRGAPWVGLGGGAPRRPSRGGAAPAAPRGGRRRSPRVEAQGLAALVGEHRHAALAAAAAASPGAGTHRARTGRRSRPRARAPASSAGDPDLGDVRAVVRGGVQVDARRRCRGSPRRAAVGRCARPSSPVCEPGNDRFRSRRSGR
jgi:single-stranded DNA-binding protein